MNLVSRDGTSTDLDLAWNLRMSHKYPAVLCGIASRVMPDVVLVHSLNIVG